MTFVLLTPALTCPGLVRKGECMEVLLLAEPKDDIRDDLSNLTYSVWKTKKEKTFDKKDFEIIPFTPSDCTLSQFVVSVYKKRGFEQLVRARITMRMDKGLYQLHNPFHEDITEIIKEVNPPPLVSSPLLPDRCTKTSFFSREDVKLHHPFYVGEKDYLTIAHLSDSHLAARLWMLEDRWNSNFNKVWEASSLSGEKTGAFSHYVSQVEHILKSINADQNIDVIIHTGDIVDYNRGYGGKGENSFSRDYFFNRNWLLFYELLLKYYEKPFFSVLGNHDYRMNPYFPSPSFIREFYNMAPTVNLTHREMDTIHEKPHSLNIPEVHIMTAPHAVHWYSVVLNPLFDYHIFYGNMAFLMLDWNEEEDYEKDNPWADNVLSQKQWDMLMAWRQKVTDYRKEKKIIAVVAMHSSVFNPFREMGDEKLSTEPETNIFYESGLTDRYSCQEDLVNGTFRHKRNEFIRVCVGNDEYGKNYHFFPERGIDLILTGHSHRSGLFQVEGPHVYLRRPDAIKEGPLFCNSISSGPIGVKNEKGGLKRVELASPGYQVVFVGEKTTVEMRTSDLVRIREEARRSYGEIARDEAFEVLDEVRNLPRLSPTYSWKVTNLKDGSTITRVTIFTGLKEPVEVTKVPVGWKNSVKEVNGFTAIVCEAHDRGQGIFYEDTGEIHVKAAEHTVEKMGTVAVCWDMTDQGSSVCVRVPAD